MPIELDHLTYTYLPGTPRAVNALQDICLQIQDGECVGIMGHTGCGKSTMIQLIAGLLIPTGGRVFLDGADINQKGYDRNILRRDVGVVFQEPEYQLFETTVEKDVTFGLKYSGLSRGEMVERARQALEIVGFSFERIRNQSPLALSGGEKRRVAIAGVLAVKPKILIFDEPFAGLDPLGRESFLHLVSRLHQNGLTLLIISHNADAMSECAERILILDGGRLLADGTAKKVLSNSSRMQALGLGVSAPREIADLLSARGMKLPEPLISYQELLSILKVKLTEGGGG